MLKNEFQYYLDHQIELVAKYENKYIVVKDNSVVGVFDDAAHALHQSRKQYKPGTYLVQLCTPGTSAYTVNACSRIIV